MVHGAPDEARWLRPQPRLSLPANAFEKIVATAFPGHTAVDIRPLADGFRNANFRIQLDLRPETFVLRVYEHAASICRKEVDLLNRIGHSVPVPEVLYAEPGGMDEIPPFALFRYVEGIAFRDLKRTGDARSIFQAAYDAGRTLAAIGRITFRKPGWIGPGPNVTAPLLEGINPGPRFVDLCLASSHVRQRLKPKLRNRISALVWSCARELASLDDESQLVHGDFSGRNLLVRKVGASWTVAAVLDWEFAVAGSPLSDVGHFLRYERWSHPTVEPHFSSGYLQAGGRLPRDWRRWARVVDLVALCESLTHEALPGPTVAELIELVSATVDGRNPEFR